MNSNIIDLIESIYGSSNVEYNEERDVLEIKSWSSLIGYIKDDTLYDYRDNSVGRIDIYGHKIFDDYGDEIGEFDGWSLNQFIANNGETLNTK